MVHSTRPPQRIITACANELVNRIRCNNAIYLQQHIFVCCCRKCFYPIKFASDPERQIYWLQITICSTTSKASKNPNILFTQKCVDPENVMNLFLWLKRRKECFFCVLVRFILSHCDFSIIPHMNDGCEE